MYDSTGKLDEMPRRTGKAGVPHPAMTLRVYAPLAVPICTTERLDGICGAMGAPIVAFCAMGDTAAHQFGTVFSTCKATLAAIWMQRPVGKGIPLHGPAQGPDEWGSTRVIPCQVEPICACVYCHLLRCSWKAQVMT